MCSCGLDQGSYGRCLVAGQIVHDDDIADTQFWYEDALDPGLKDVAVDGAIDDERSHDATVAQACDEGRGLPVSVRGAHAQPLASEAASVAARHVGAGPAFVHEYQSVGIEVDLLLQPGRSPAQDVRAILLGGMRRLFLRVSPRRPRKRHSVP